MNFYIILLTFLLLIICIKILIIVSPIIDHLFDIDEIDKMDELTMYSNIILHIILLGVLILGINYFVINKYIKYFKIEKHEKYIKLLMDLVLTLTLVGLQKNLTTKLKYVTSVHPIRSN